MNNPITRVGKQGLDQLGKQVLDQTKESDESFGETLEKFINEVNGLQNQASMSIEKLATGEITDVHEVMIAVEEANTALEFMLEIRNKIVEAYQEVMRMPV